MQTKNIQEKTGTLREEVCTRCAEVERLIAEIRVLISKFSAEIEQEDAEVNGVFRLRTIRKALRITQEELAEMLGVTQSCLSMWETGAAFPCASKLPAIAQILGCKIDDLFENGWR